MIWSKILEVLVFVLRRVGFFDVYYNDIYIFFDYYK